MGDTVLADPLVRELLAARLVAVLSTMEPDGSIHAVPMWFAVRNGVIVLATGSRSRKVRNLEHDSRATLVLHDSRPGFEVCGVSVQGRTTLVRGAEAAPLVELVHRRYVAPEGEALPDAAAFLSSDDVAVLFEPLRALAWDERASVAAEALRASGTALALVPTDPRP